MEIKDIIQAIRSNKVKITDHADEEARDDDVSYDELFLSVYNGEIIESYLKDRPYPSCLIYGRAFDEEPIHSVWGFNQNNGWAVLITVYRPGPNKWIDPKTRRKENESL